MIRKFLSLAIVGGTLVACQGPTGENEPSVQEQSDQAEQNTNEAEAENEVAEIRIYPKPAVAEFPDASLSLVKPENGENINEGEVNFEFALEGYTLGEQTTEARMALANSAKGQHIHLIIDNDPYSAHYESQFSQEIEDGNHYAIAFLSRSYHESVKNPNAYEVFQFAVGDTDEMPVDLSQPALFYSRPKGTYSGEGAEKVLFDFYLHNTEISGDGNKVKLVINDEEEFMLDKWQPYIIEGLPMGENKIFIELVDKEGNRLDVPINSVTRVFNLEE